MPDGLKIRNFSVDAAESGTPRRPRGYRHSSGASPITWRIQVATKARDIFIDGLRNAHAMEIQARELMERQSERLTDYPEVKSRVQTHLRETEGQLKRLEQCLSSLGESTSTMKDTAQSLMGNIMALGHSMAGDEILKNTFANNAFEHFEIAAYKSLLTLCGPAGADGTRTLLEQSLKEEEAMASWVDENVGKVTLAYLNREERAAA
jgi:ferritin-like metal-binding protein YciE